MSEEKEYDVIVIGGGPGGYPAAIRASQLGMKTLCIDKWVNRDGSPSFGGTCLNAGCIPSKALLESSELYHRAQQEFSLHGINLGKVNLDIKKMQSRKQAVSKINADGVRLLFQANKVTGIHGHGRLLGSNRVGYRSLDGKQEEVYQAKHIIIATGSAPTELKGLAPFDGDRVVDSWGALDFEVVPQRLGIIGAGVIGIELGSVWSRLGSKTIVVEAMNEFLPSVDRQIANEAFRTLGKQGLDIKLGCTVSSVVVNDKKGVVVKFEREGKTASETFDKLIVAAGRRPYTEELNCDAAGVELDSHGFIRIDKRYQTSAPNVYAVGDVTGGAMLAHKAIEEGVTLAEQLVGQKSEVNYRAVPSVIYTSPEIAWVGLSEQQAKNDGYQVKVGSSSFLANGRARAMEQASGVIKIISDTKSDRVLGIHMIGPYVSELAAEAVLALEFAATTADIQLTMHAHPTLSEALHEAALAVDGHAIHSANRPARKSV